MNMKINVLRIILIILLMGTFCIIFGFSSQDSEKSGSISRKVTEIITTPIKWVQEKPEQEKEQILSRIEKVVRKIAHFSIYTVVRNIAYGIIKNF